MICCCCGAKTSGKQWHNRDTGYGLCKSCLAYIRRHRLFGGEPMTEAEIGACYGVEGVHCGID